MTKHPNASVSTVVGAFMVLVTWIVSNWVDVPQFVWAACTTLVIAFVLFLGKRSHLK